MQFCPKCHRPIDPGADGLCCAQASRHWRCTNCGRVSEGFAFAYRRCPQCGGELATPLSRRIGDPAALDAIRTAFEIELGGRAFYQRAAAACVEPSLRDLFARFALMEGEHMETLARRYHVDLPSQRLDLKAELSAIFGTPAGRPNDPETLFRTAITMEQRAAEFFTERAQRAAPGSNEQRLYSELATEEQEHVRTLGDEYERWRGGKMWPFRGNLLRPETPDAPAPVRPTNAAAVLLANHDPQRTALVCGAQSMSYRVLHESVARAASALRLRGVEGSFGGGARVAIKLPDGLDWVGAFLGTVWAGGVAVAVNPRIPPAEWEYILDEAGFQVIIAESIDDTPAAWRSRVVRLDDWRRAVASSPPLAPEPMHPDAPAFWCHSSGTSGKPKAVVHAHRAARSIDQVSRDALGIRSDDRIFASSKLFFAYPQTNSLFAGLKLGATVVLDPLWPTAQSVAATVQAQRVSVLFSVPSLYRNLLREGLAPNVARSGVRLCVSAGEALPGNVRDAWREQTGLDIVDGYGASEALILVMLDRGDSTGLTPSPGVEIEPLGEGDGGVPTRLRIRAATLALGYLDRPQAQAEAFRDGGFCPADLFTRVEGGGWRFAGREDSLVKIGARWVDLFELEQRLASACPQVAEGAAVCVADADGVDAVAYFYVSADPAAATAAETALREFAQQLPHHQRPRWLHAVDALPRGPTGKLLRRKLQELHPTSG